MMYMERRDAIDLLFSDLIDVHIHDDQFIAIERVTHMIGVGKTKEEAISNLKDAILLHIDALKAMLETTKIEYHFKKLNEL